MIESFKYTLNVLWCRIKMEKPKSFLAKTISGGRITIPDELRQIWKIEDGDFVMLEIVSVVKPSVNVGSRKGG